MPEELTLGQLAYVAVIMVLYLGLGVVIGRSLRGPLAKRIAKYLDDEEVS